MIVKVQILVDITSSAHDIDNRPTVLSSNTPNNFHKIFLKPPMQSQSIIETQQPDVRGFPNMMGKTLPYP